MFFRFRVGEGDASARCLCRSPCLFGKRRKGMPMLGGRQCVDAGRCRRCGEKTADVAQQRRIVGSPLSLCDRSALSGVSRVRTCRAIARALHSKLFFCLHSFTHVTQTFVLHVIRSEDLCAAPSPPRWVDRVSGSSRAVIPFFLAAMPYFARVFEEKRAVFQSRPR